MEYDEIRILNFYFLTSGDTKVSFNAKAIDKDLNPSITYTATETEVSNDAEGLDTAPSDGWFSTTTGKLQHKIVHVIKFWGIKAIAGLISKQV